MLISVTFYVIIRLVNTDIALYIVTICAISPYPSARHAVLTQICLNNATLSPGFRLCQCVQQHLLYTNSLRLSFTTQRDALLLLQ